MNQDLKLVQFQTLHLDKFEILLNILKVEYSIFENALTVVELMIYEKY